MAISSSVAKQLCTANELTLFTAGLPKNIGTLDARQLKSRVSRSRKLRDKYSQLAKRQDREARGKQKPRGRQPSQGSAATRKKEQLFAESLARFEKRLATVEKAKKPAVKKAAKAAPSKAAKRPTKKTAAKRKTPRKSAAAKAKQSARPSAVKRGKKAATARTPKKSAAVKSATTKAKKSRVSLSAAQRKQTHITASNRRHQGKRDAR